MTTEHRVAWVAERASAVRYFASLQNRASIALHEKLGFHEVRRGIAHPRIRFTGGIGALYALPLGAVG
jgi:RimJ/RimL family protein N-acetyltransferase